MSSMPIQWEVYSCLQREAFSDALKYYIQSAAIVAALQSLVGQKCNNACLTLSFPAKDMTMVGVPSELRKILFELTLTAFPTFGFIRSIAQIDDAGPRG